MSKVFFITGAAGFIGSNLVRSLRAAYPDAELISYDLLTYAGHIENLKDFEDDPKHHFFQGNIGDEKLVLEILEKFNVDAIFHLAAETHVDRSISGADPFIETNVAAHTRFLRTAQNYQQSLNASAQEQFRFIHISTDEVFGHLSIDDPAFDEQTPYAPRSPYAASKAAGDHLVRAWHNTYKLPAIILNCSNNFGPYQYPEKLIPFMLSRALAGQSLPIYGSGEQIRDWLYVEDHCQAIIKAYECGEIGETYCIGGSNEQRNIDIVHRLCEILDERRPREDNTSYKSLIEHVEDRPGHDFRYAINSEKAQKSLSWSAGTNFATLLTQTIDWYIENTEWINIVQKNK